MPLENGLWKISLADLAARAKQRPEGYVDDVLSRAVRVDATHYWITPEARRELVTKYLPQPTREQAERAERRRAVCRACDDNQGMSNQGVRCRDCGCGVVSFIHGTCKRGKW